MKKFTFLAAAATAFLLFPGCEFLKNLMPKDETVPALPVKSVQSFEITTPTTDISQKVTENSRVYVVQVNTLNENVDSYSAGTLKNEVPFPENEASVYSRMAFDDEVPFNDPPLFIDYSHLKEKASHYNENKIPVRKSVYRSIGEEYVEFTVPKNNGYNPDYEPLFDCELKYESKHAYVYFAPNINMLKIMGMEEDYDLYESYLQKCNDFLKLSDFKKIGQVFDAIYEAETKLLGSNTDFNRFSGFIKPSSQKVTILLNDIYDDSSYNQNGGTFGYFYGGDFLLDDGSETSNECQIIYIDTVLYEKYPDTALSTLAHEFAHLLNFCNKEMKTAQDISENTWFTEMLAMVSEDLLYESVLEPQGIYSNSVIKNRIPYYLAFHDQGITSWGGNDSLPYYGNTFAFGSFLVRNYGGPELIHKIATNSDFNENAVTEALSSLNYSESFNDVVREFAISSMNYRTTDEKKIKTLNKSVSQTNNGNVYKAGKIDVSSYKNKSGNPGLELLKSGRTTDLGAHGFTVQYAGEGSRFMGEKYEKLSVSLPKRNGIKMYCVIQEIEKNKEDLL